MLTPDQQQYLRDHRLGALGTGKRDGSPQLTWIAYEYDGADVVLQTGGNSAKARNIRRSASVALLVPDGGRNLVVYGMASLLESGPERLAAIRRVRATSQRPLGEISDADLERELDERGTVAVRIVPERAMGRIVERGA